MGLGGVHGGVDGDRRRVGQRAAALSSRRQRASVSTLTVFVGVIGGVAAFGFIGSLIGPVVVALIVAPTAVCRAGSPQSRQLGPISAAVRSEARRVSRARSRPGTLLNSHRARRLLPTTMRALMDLSPILNPSTTRSVRRLPPLLGRFWCSPARAAARPACSPIESRG